MKRDMDLVRMLLLKIEAGKKQTMSDLVNAECRIGDPEDIGYHLRMLIKEAGVVTGIDVCTCDGDHWIHLELTWFGHEFLDDIRDPEIWRRTKEGAASIGSFSIDTLRELAKGFVKHKLHQHTGILIS
jgi:hypothetical protein